MFRTETGAKSTAAVDAAAGRGVCDGTCQGQESVDALTAWLGRHGRFTAVVGAGGKSTLIYALAHTVLSQGGTVIVTTSTHIWQPAYLPWTSDLRTLSRLLRQSRLAVYGRPDGTGKLGAPGVLDAEVLLRLADIVLTEADGSRGLPCKVPAPHEPAIPRDAQAVVAVCGLTALGKPLAEACCRPKEASALLERPPEAPLREADVARILSSEAGGRRHVGNRPYAVVLNQCDNGNLAQRAAAVRRMLAESGISDVFCTSRAY